MSFDGTFIHSLLTEIKPELVNSKVSKVYQPFEHELVFVFRINRQNKKLLISSNPQYNRMNLTDEKFTNPTVPPTFAMVLRKHLEGSFLFKIEQVGNDRIVNFYFLTRNEYGDEEELVLSAEFMGRHSNIILYSKRTNKIIDLIKRIAPDKNRARLLLPKADYELPPLTDQENPFDLSLEEFNASVKDSDDLSTLSGLSGQTKNELNLWFDKKGKSYQEFTAFFAQFNTPKATEMINNGKTSFAPIPPIDIDNYDEIVSYPSLSELLANFYQRKANSEWVKQRSSHVDMLTKNQIKKLKKKIQALIKQQNQAENSEDYRIKGELLTTYLHQVKPGMPEIELPNYYDENNSLIKINLKPELTPSKNSQWYFSKYQKLRNSIKYVQEQINIARSELNYFQGIEENLRIATPNDIEQIVQELREQGYLKKNRKQQKTRNHKKLSEQDITKYQSSEGNSILVGKNNFQNEWLTFKKAQKKQYWFHVKDIPGSHVILQTTEPTDAEIQEAAEIAAYYSKAQSSAHVQVDYVEVKRVKKPNGAKPGFVIYTGQNSIEVTPQPNKIDRMKL